MIRIGPIREPTRSDHRPATMRPAAPRIWAAVMSGPAEFEAAFCDDPRTGQPLVEIRYPEPPSEPVRFSLPDPGGTGGAGGSAGAVGSGGIGLGGVGASGQPGSSGDPGNSFGPGTPGRTGDNGVVV